MLGLGIWVTTQDTEYKHLAGNLYVTIGYIVLASFVFVIGFLGACGILLMKQNLLKVYFALMLLLLMMELGIAIYIYVEKDKIQDHIAENWNKTSDEARIIIQQEFNCCGIKPVNLKHQSSSHKSCFVDQDKTNERLKDCYTHLMDWIKENHIILATCSVIVAVLQMFILGGTCRLIAEIESGDRSVKRTRVVPLNIQQNNPRQENTRLKNTGQTSLAQASTGQTISAQANTGQTKAGSKPQHASAHTVQQEDDDDFEDGTRRATARRNWAKINPKYNSVLTLLEK